MSRRPIRTRLCRLFYFEHPSVIGTYFLCLLILLYRYLHKYTQILYQ